MTVLAPLWDWFGREAIPFFGRLGLSLLQGHTKLFGPTLLVILKVALFFWACIETLSWALGIINGAMDSLFASSLAGPDSTLLVYGAFINRFVPLLEAFACAVFLLQLYVTVLIIRWIKSFIPFFSN